MEYQACGGVSRGAKHAGFWVSEIPTPPDPRPSHSFWPWLRGWGIEGGGPGAQTQWGEGRKRNEGKGGAVWHPRGRTLLSTPNPHRWSTPPRNPSGELIKPDCTRVGPQLVATSLFYSPFHRDCRRRLVPLSDAGGGSGGTRGHACNRPLCWCWCWCWCWWGAQPDRAGASAGGSGGLDPRAVRTGFGDGVLYGRGGLIIGLIIGRAAEASPDLHPLPPTTPHYPTCYPPIPPRADGVCARVLGAGEERSHRSPIPSHPPTAAVSVWRSPVLSGMRTCGLLGDGGERENGKMGT